MRITALTLQSVTGSATGAVAFVFDPTRRFISAPARSACSASPAVAPSRSPFPPTNGPTGSHSPPR